MQCKHCSSISSLARVDASSNSLANPGYLYLTGSVSCRGIVQMISISFLELTHKLQHHQASRSKLADTLLPVHSS